jgi:hypothetical protein
VAGHGEPVEAERRHHLYLVLRHGPLGVAGVVIPGRGPAAVAVAAQVGAHHREVLSQHRRHAVPHGHGLGKSMQQQQWRTCARHCHRDFRAGHRDL